MRERLSQTIYDDLLRKIKTGVYAQNDKLPTEHELMGLYGVSRVTAITALNLLRDNGYIVRVPRVGSIVRGNANRGETRGDIQFVTISDDN